MRNLLFCCLLFTWGQINAFNATWGAGDPLPNIVGYEVHYGPESAFNEADGTASYPNVTYAPGPLTRSQDIEFDIYAGDLYYSVIAVNGEGEKTPFTWEQHVKKSQVVQEYSVHLGWDAPGDDRITGYEVYYGEAPGTYTEIDQVPGKTTEEAILDVPTGLWYFAVRSRAEDLGMYSVFSNEVSMVVGEYGPPVEITNWNISYEQDEEANVATVTRTVAASGGDHTTIAAALSWFQSNHNYDDDGIARILITDSTSYTISSSISFDGISGTPDAAAYLEITSDASDPFAGPTLNMTHSGDGGFKLYDDYTYIHNLKFHLNNTNTSTECIRVHSGVDNALISRNVFISLTQTSQQDGIYTGNWVISNLRIDHNYFYGFARGGVHLQNYTGTTTQSADIHGNTFAVVIDVDYSIGIKIQVQNSGATINAAIYNNLVIIDDGLDLFYARSYQVLGDGTFNMTGSNNAGSSDNFEGTFTSSYDDILATETAPTSGENAWLTEIDTATITDRDYSIAGENAYTITGNGLDRTGSEPDSRQDFSTDIMGNARHATTPDIGAFEFVPAGAAASSIPPQMQKSFAHLLVR